jgi:hypothetical protein
MPARGSVDLQRIRSLVDSDDGLFDDALATMVSLSSDPFQPFQPA